MIQRSPILITGCGRSGASMVAATINICGAFGGNMTGVNQTIRRGMFENVYIREKIVMEYLEDAGVDTMGQYPLPDTDHMYIPKNWRMRVEQAIMDDGYRRGEWMYKDLRSALLWPVWHFAFPDAKWIIVRRRTGDVIQSCIKTGFMTAFKDMEKCSLINVKTEAEGWLWWVREYEKRFVEMITEGLNCKVVWPERMVRGNFQQLYETLEWLGLSWKEEALRFIEPLLFWENRKERRNV